MEKKNTSAEGQIHVNYVNIASLNAGLSINSSGEASCTGSVTLYNKSNTAELSVQLQKNTGNGWSAIKTWSARGNPASLVNSYYVVHGTCRVGSTAKVYNSAGTLLETQTAYSATRIY